jgi:hypothetical protein
MAGDRVTMAAPFPEVRLKPVTTYQQENLSWVPIPVQIADGS